MSDGAKEVSDCGVSCTELTKTKAQEIQCIAEESRPGPGKDPGGEEHSKQVHHGAP